MNIPDKALEAAVQALFEDGCGEPKVDAATVLEAAAPFIAAQALKDHATAVVTHRVNATPTFFEGMKFAALLAMDHASHIEDPQ